MLALIRNHLTSEGEGVGDDSTDKVTFKGSFP